MFNKIIALILLTGLLSCTKYDNNTNTATDLRSLPSIHTEILGYSYDFPAPTSYQMWDATTDCTYEQNNLVFDITVGLDGKLYTLPTGKYNGQIFIITPPSSLSGATILFTGLGVQKPCVWVMVP